MGCRAKIKYPTTKSDNGTGVSDPYVPNTVPQFRYDSNRLSEKIEIPALRVPISIPVTQSSTVCMPRYSRP